MHDQQYERKISLLDWGIIISSLLLLLTIFLPQAIWVEEETFKKEGRKRMSDIANAEDFYYEMTGSYTLNGEHLFDLVEAAMDSLIADSLYIGNQIINLQDGSYSVNLERGFEIRVDTTFSDPTDLYVSYSDTVYKVGMKNLQSGGEDTIFVNVKDLLSYKLDENFMQIISSDIVVRSEKKLDYLRKKYHLDDSFLYCPVTKNPYVLEIDSTDGDAIFQVTSPLHLLEKPYKESRYIFFSFEAGDHGFIRGGQKSWAE